MGSLILVGGSIGDIYGERRAFVVGLSAFGLFSVGCAAAPTIEVLVAARALQGAAAALMVPGSLAIIVAAFQPDKRGAAIGAWTAWGGIAAIAGPLAGGPIVDQASWRWIFVLNVPLVIATVGLVLAAVPAAPRATERHVDFLGAGLCAAGLAGVVFALIEQPHYGWSSPVIVVLLIGGLLAFASFVWYERRIAQPMLRLELFSRRNFAIGNAETLAVYGGLRSCLRPHDLPAAGRGLHRARERSGGPSCHARRVRPLTAHRRPRRPLRAGVFMGAGPVVAACGILLLLRTGLDTDFVTDLLPALLVFAFGLSLTVAPLVATVLADADESDAGIASAVNNAFARVAGLVGVSVVGVVLAETLVDETLAANTASVRAIHEAVLICACLVAAGVR